MYEWPPHRGTHRTVTYATSTTEQVILLGPGEPEMLLEAAVIQTPLL